MADTTSLDETVERFVSDDFEGFADLIPVAAGHDLMRKGKQDLTVIRMTTGPISILLKGADNLPRWTFRWNGKSRAGSGREASTTLKKSQHSFINTLDFIALARHTDSGDSYERPGLPEGRTRRHIPRPLVTWSSPKPD